MSVLSVTPQPGELSLTWTLPSGAYAAIVRWRKTGDPTWNQALPYLYTSTVLYGLDPVKYDVSVVCLPAGGVLRSSGTPLAVPPPPPPAPPPPRVGVINGSQLSGWRPEVAPALLRAGLDCDRIDVHAGSATDLALLDVALATGFRVLPLYNPPGFSATYPLWQVTAEVSALGRALAARRVFELEIINEPYDVPGVTAPVYADYFAAAKLALAGTGVRAIAMTTGDYARADGTWSKDLGSTPGGWTRDLWNALPADAKPDGWSCHPYPPGGVVSAVANEHNGWPCVKSWHDIALSLGSTAPWYVTEVGIKLADAGSEAAQAQALGELAQGLRHADPRVVGTPYDFVTWLTFYSAVDDNPAANWGLFDKGTGAPRLAVAAVTSQLT